VIARLYLVVLFVLVATSCSRTPDRFEPLRQATVEAVPGTLSYELEPVGDYRPEVAPDADYTALAKRTPGTVTVTLATVHDTDFGTRWGPAWVFFARDVCFATSKGDVVSPARSGNEACTDANMWVQAIDATNGATLGSFTAYDGSERWTPQREGDPSQVPGTTRFH
jgi:hypothetical protein